MDRFTMYPIAFITTVQPWVAAWVLSISFFLTMFFVAILAKGRSAKQVMLMTVVGYVAITIVTGLGTAFMSGFAAVSVEVVSVAPNSTFGQPD